MLDAIRTGRVGERAGALDPVRLLPRADETPTQAMPAARTRVVPRGALVSLAAAAFAAVIVVVSAPGRQPDRGTVVGYLPQERSAVFEGSAAPIGAALVVENRLTEPIAVSVEDTGLTISPGDTGRLPLTAERPLEADWAMVQPAIGERVLGRPVEGAIVADRVDRELFRVVDANAEGRALFAPAVVNRAGRALRVAVLAGDDSVDCECRIANGDSLGLGYYPDPEQSALRVTDGAGWSARFTGLAARRDSASGAVVVRVERRDLRPPPGGTPRRAKPSRTNQSGSRNPLSSFLPVR
jgi:hypothetical protein